MGVVVHVHWSIEYGLMTSCTRVFSYIDEGVRFLCVWWTGVCVQFGVLHCFGGYVSPFM